MVHIPRKNLKMLAISLRRKGFSYTEIRSAANIPKSTLSLWLRDVELSETETQRLIRKRNSSRRKAVETRSLKILETTEKVIKNSSAAIKDISKKELWLMGIILYWREGFLKNNFTNLKKGVRFTSSNPALIRFFLKWLKEVGRIEKEELFFDIFCRDEKGIADPVAYWSLQTGYPRENFPRVYFQARYQAKNRRKEVPDSNNGFLRIRVRSSSMMARQIAGWITGIEEILCNKV